MMEEIGMGAANFGRHGLECYGLGSVGEQYAPCRFESDGAAFLGIEAFAAY